MSKNQQLEEIKNIIKSLDLMDYREVSRCYKEIKDFLRIDDLDLSSFEEKKINKFMDNLYELEKLLKEMERQQKNIVY